MSCGRELSVSCKVFTKNFFATKFISHFLVQYFWQKLETNLQFNSICHPQTDEQTKVGNRSLDNILGSFVGKEGLVNILVSKGQRHVIYGRRTGPLKP